MQHNWVLIGPGTADKVAQDSITAGAAKGWLALGPSVLAHTKLVDPKKSDTVEFVAPTKPGDYPFICTFPGHAMTMKVVARLSTQLNKTKTTTTLPNSVCKSGNFLSKLKSS